MLPPDAVLSWSDVSKSYGRRPLFSALTGKLHGGQAIAVTGVNGSGKSTFLKIAAGLLSADTGSINRPSLHNVGYCSPSLELYGDLTGAENLKFFAAVAGQPDRVGHESFELVGLTKASNKPYSSYSSGMKQRLKLAFATLLSPKLLILDEPTIALDSDGVLIVDGIIKRQRDNGGSVLIATNDRSEALRWGDSRLEIGSQAW